MAVPPNLVLGAAGAAIALVTASVLVTNWRDLTELQDWEATFREHDILLPTRSATLDPGSGAKRTEEHAIGHVNVTTVHVSLTWRDPAFPSPSPPVSLRVLGPDNRARAFATHQGGTVGIDVDVELVPPDDIPKGSHRYSSRGDPHVVFDQRWPSHPEGQGLWKFEITNTASGPGAGSVYYTLRVGYEYYEGTVRSLAVEAVK